MALDATIPIDGDGVTTGVRVSELAGSIRTLRTDINIILDGYDTGWIARSDWTNVHIGSSTTKNADSNVNHGLDVPLSDLLVTVLASSDGTDANSFQILDSNYTDQVSGTLVWGFTPLAVDNDNIKIQTATNGITAILDAGGQNTIDTEDWYYKIKVWSLG